MYKSVNDQLPDNLTSMLKLTENVHNHNLRNCNGFYSSGFSSHTGRYKIKGSCTTLERIRRVSVISPPPSAGKGSCYCSMVVMFAPASMTSNHRADIASKNLV